VFYAYFSTYVQPDVFDFTLVTLILAASALGGTKSIWAAPVAAAVIVIGPDQAAAFAKYSGLAYGVLLMVIGVAFTPGLAGVGRLVLDRLSARGARDDDSAITADREVAAPATTTAPLSIAGAVLRTVGVAKSFGGVHALAGVDLEAQPRAITAIIGANGAGKTTLLNAISGLIPVDRGEVWLGDEELSRLRADKIARAGVSRTFQTPQIPESLSVLDVAASGLIGEHWVPSVEAGLRSPRYRRVRRSDIARARAALAFVGLDGEEELPAQLLPLGRRRILEVARCIAAEPSVVLFDEPAAGCDPEALDILGGVLRKLRDEGATVVLIEHNVSFVMGIADTVYVMGLGAVIAHGSPEDVRQDEAVISSYLGRRHMRHHPLDEPQRQPEPVRVADDE
jgi:branched-chain amino acid transport system permease protein